MHTGNRQPAAAAIGRAIMLVCLTLAWVEAAASSNAVTTRVDRSGRDRTGDAVTASLERDGDEGAAASTRADTLWIFDADFSDLVGDNAGWTSVDMSGTLAVVNYWHKDTIRLTEPYLGDSTWWCGTYDPKCWRQPRGYGNNWLCCLVREFPLSEWSQPGDQVTIEWDQRYAIERNYDYAYVDISDDGGGTWNTLLAFCNPGFTGPGISIDWDSVTNGHRTLDVSSYAGGDASVRFRFESDGAYSSQDQADNAQHSVKDGAWQLDNIEWRVNGETPWVDDCESPGDNGWVTDDIPATGQAGVVFHRGRFGIDFFTGREGPDCFAPPVGTWMMAAVETATGKMVDHQDAWVTSPSIGITGAEHLVTQWTMWVDLPQDANDLFSLRAWSFDEDGCPVPEGWFDGFEDEVWGAWYGGPFWGTWSHDLSAWAGNDTLRFRWEEWNYEHGTEPHMGGIFLVRQRVGIPPSYDPATRFSIDQWHWFHDWFVDDISEAVVDTARVRVRDDDGVASLTLLASATAGGPFQSYACEPEDPVEPEWYLVPPPAGQIVPATEIHYYFEAMDDLGNTALYPAGAPDETFEMSILPINASVTEPGLLLVDKDGELVPGEARDYRHSSEYYLREALDVLGYRYDVYDVEVPGGMSRSDGPDTSGMKYYDTQIWFGGARTSCVMLRSDQLHLIQWLGQASGETERNLLISGDSIGWELQSAASNKETLGFMSDWMGAHYVSSGLADTLPTLRDAPGGYAFMTHDDGACDLAGGCPEVPQFDVIEPDQGATGAEVAVEYETTSRGVLPGGVANTDPALGYQTVMLAFGPESMMDDFAPSGRFRSAIADRSDLVGNIMDYFGRPPDGSGTDVPADGPHVTRLELAQPNPFNPVTTLSYAVAAEGRVRIVVYNLAGRVVRTLVDADLPPGEYRATWDGATDSGDHASSGVYFVRMDADGFTAMRKAVMLK